MKTIFLELNEFNENLLQEAGQALHLKNIQRLFSFHKSATWTDDTYDSGFLEPWVQWVSVHTGLPSSEHQVKHLGNVPQVVHKQLWEKLSDKKISSGIWGAMNAKRKAADCLFFFPDPWTDEKAYPSELNALLQPLRHISQNYTSCSKLTIAGLIKDLLILTKKNKLMGFLGKEITSLAKNVLRYKAKPFVFVSFLDLLSSHFFLEYQKQFQPTFSLLFLNSIAHLQHHQWTSKEGISPPLAHGFKNIDKILGKIFALLQPDDLFIVTNALSQKNTTDEKPWVLYRQINQRKFLQLIGIQKVTIEAHMTHDAHLFFRSAQSTQQALAILQSVKLNGSPFFHIESYPDNPLKLFYRIQFTDPVPQDAFLTVSNKLYPFFKLFKAIVKRTGKHIQTGTLFSNKPYFSERLANHEIEEQILNIYDQNCQRKEPVMPQSR
ncbi:MAG: alkaline phosphatase family protein [Chlamydiota bacterium]|jgi:hypothetical protein